MKRTNKRRWTERTRLSKDSKNKKDRKQIGLTIVKKKEGKPKASRQEACISAETGRKVVRPLQEGTATEQTKTNKNKQKQTETNGTNRTNRQTEQTEQTKQTEQTEQNRKHRRQKGGCAADQKAAGVRWRQSED